MKTENRKIIVGIEGGMASGKSSLCKHFSDALIISEYMDFIDDQVSFHNKSPEDRFTSLLEIEKCKRKPIVDNALLERKPKLILLDRSYITLLAHEFAVKSKINSIDACNSLAKSENVILPDIIFFLDVAHKERLNRYTKRGDNKIDVVQNVFLTERYNIEFFNFIAKKQNTVPIHIINTTNTSTATIAKTIREILPP
jgi:thymidylate kinase